MCKTCEAEHRAMLEAYNWPRSRYEFPFPEDDIAAVDLEAEFWERFDKRHAVVPAILTIDPAEFKRRWDQLWTGYRASAQSRAVGSW